MKCGICGDSLFLKRKVKLLDNVICADCFKGLGYNMNDVDVVRNISLQDLKPRDELMQELSEMGKKKIVEDALSNISINIAGYGQEKDIDFTDEECKIFNRVCKMLDYNKSLDLVHKSPNYATIIYKGYDIMRLKFTQRAKWFNFPIMENGDVKHRIDEIDDIDEYAIILQDSASRIRNMRNE